MYGSSFSNLSVEALAAAGAVEDLAMLVAGRVAQQVIQPGKGLPTLVTPEIIRTQR